MGRIDDALRQAGRKPAAAQGGADEEAVNAFAASDGRGPEQSAVPVSPRQSIVVEKSPFLDAARLVMHADTEPVVVEQYRRLAAVLHHAQVERGVKVIMLASAQAGEGKTLTAVNLALTLSESYKRRVLLIDADLRRPSVGRIFGVSAPAGLSECLKSRELQSIRVTYVTDELGLLLAGHADHDPMAGLTSGRMHDILEQASEQFDWVVIDTPPVGLLTDAHLLAAMVDAAVLVINAGTTQHPVVQQAIASIGREKIVGVVLNRVEDSALADAAYYDYYSDGKSTRKRSGYLSARGVAADVTGLTR